MKHGAVEFVSSLVCAAKERPPFFNPLLNCIFKFCYTGSDAAVKSLVGVVFMNVNKETALTPEEVKTLMDLVVMRVFT